MYFWKMSYREATTEAWCEDTESDKAIRLKNPAR